MFVDTPLTLLALFSVEAAVEASFADSWAKKNNWSCYYYCCQQSAVEKWAHFAQWPPRLPNSPQMLSLR